MKLNVGQIVFVVLDKQTVVYPMLVIEEIIKRTMHKGEIVSDVDYILQAGGSKPKTISLSNIQGQVFESSESAKNSLMDNATFTINKLIENAVSKASEWYGNSAVDVPQYESSSLEEEDDDIAYVNLGNGIKGKIKL
jgi:hypothetical protein